MTLLHKIAELPDRVLFAGLFVLSIIVRIPFLATFDLVSYDGTYYINLARSVIDVTAVSGPFPLGYPLHMVPLMIVGIDDVRAAQIISFLAGLGSLFVLYTLTKELVSKTYAIAAALVLASSPLFIRFSLNTMSESVFIFWVLFGLLCYQRHRYPLFGLSFGVAAISRPEALPVFLLLAALRWRHRRQLLTATAAFVVIYAINSIIFSLSTGQIVLMQKANNLGLSAMSWKSLEVWFGREELRPEMAHENLFVHFLKRFPAELLLIARHATPAVLLVAIYGMVKRRSFLILSLIPFFAYPLFTPRSEPRFVLPYIPVLILFAMIGLDSLRGRRLHLAVAVILFVTVTAGCFVNIDMLTDKVSAGYETARDVGRNYRDEIDRRDRVADRKPFFAFYAQGKFTKIPAATYEETMRYLVEQNVRILSLHQATTHVLRPALRPLLYDRAVINGELRFTQIHHEASGELLYVRNPRGFHEQRHVITPLDGTVRLAPCWSPDARWIAYRARSSGKAEIRVVSPDGANDQSVISERPTTDTMSWAPDSRRLAFATMLKDKVNIYTYDLTAGKLEPITDDDGNDSSPSWSRDGSEIVFSSDRSGSEDIWVIHLATGALTQITTDGGNRYPAISPDGRRIAWIREDGLIIYDRDGGQMIRAVAPAGPSFAPAWNSDGRCIAVTGNMWGATTIFLVRSDGGDALLLTKSTDGHSMPAWSPDDSRIVMIARENERLGLCVVGDMRPYLERLDASMDIFTFDVGQGSYGP